MDPNLAFACVGYGSAKQGAFLRHQGLVPLLSAPFILRESDPIGFCVTAMSEAHPEWSDEIDSETRAMILHRLQLEAARVGGV